MPTLEDQIRAAFERVAAQTLVDPAPAFKVLDRTPVQFSEEETAMLDLEAPSHTDEHRKGSKRVLVAGLLAAAAVAAIAVVATRDGDDATPADQPAPTVTMTVPPRALFGTQDEQFVPGTYFVDAVGESPTPRIFVTLGDGWYNSIDDRVVRNDDVGALGVSRIDAVPADACHSQDEEFHPGPVTTLDGVVAALYEQAGWWYVTAPTDISVNGYHGKTFRRTAPSSFIDCEGAVFGPWLSPDGYWSLIQAGEVETLRILDVNGALIVIDTRLNPDHHEAAAIAELAAVLNSIRIAQA